MTRNKYPQLAIAASSRSHHNLIRATARPDRAAPGGGRGLWVVHQVCDLAQIRSGPAGTTIRVHMRLDC
jgi:hypothetical protein